MDKLRSSDMRSVAGRWNDARILCWREPAVVMSAMKAETLKMRLSPQEFERLLINAFCLPEKCTDVNIHMRAGCPTTVVVEYILTPIQIEGDSVKKARMLLARDTRMADWWRYGGWRRYM